MVPKGVVHEVRVGCLRMSEVNPVKIPRSDSFSGRTKERREKGCSSLVSSLQ